MKSIFKILVLGVVPILALTAVMDLGLAADKGSQLIFQSNMAHTNYISVSNTSANAVTVLVQYYNDELEPVLYYLRVITGGGTVLVDPFDHEIPGTAEMDDDDMEIAGTATNVSDELATLPLMTNDDDGPGINSGQFVIAVTAVGANMAIDEDGNGDAKQVTLAATNSTEDSEENNARTVNVLFPTFLAAGMHGVNNIDNGGVLIDDSAVGGATGTLSQRTKGEDNVSHSGENLKLTKPAEGAEKDTTSKNVGGLTVGNAEPIAFNHLTGHFTEALISTPGGGADQTASWGGTPIIRPGVLDNNNAMMGDGPPPTAGAPDPDDVVDYLTLTGVDSAADDLNRGIFGGGRLAEKDAGGNETLISHEVEGYTTEGGNEIIDGTAYNRGVSGGSLVLPALYAGGAETHQIMLLLSAADSFGGYKLIPAMTKYDISLEDNMGNKLPSPADDRVFGGATGPELPKLGIIVEGISVMVDAGKCGGTMIDGRWSLAHLTGLIPTASSGSGDFAGLDAMMDAMKNASPGSIKFKRGALICKMDYGDGDAATSDAVDTSVDGDGVPATDERTYSAGTLIVEEKNTERTFVTTGQALLKFFTPGASFAASWSLKSPASTNDPARVDIPADVLVRVE